MTPEMKQMLGGKELDSDGFTYVYGKHKQGRVKRKRNINSCNRCKRYDKRAVKAKELKFEMECDCE